MNVGDVVILVYFALLLGIAIGLKMGERTWRKP